MSESTETTPGLKWRARAGGRRVPYWVARADLVAKGYRPKTVRLEYRDDEPMRDAIVESRCRVLQAEMLQWSSTRRNETRTFDGTLNSLVAQYETDPESPYADLEPETQKTYSKHLELLMRGVGTLRVDAVTGADVRRWYKAIAKNPDPTKPPRLSYAYLTISIFKVVVSYGATLGGTLGAACATLRAAMAAAKFKNGPARTTQFTYQHLRAFRAKAFEIGKVHMALGVTLQFALAFRQRDVIGKYTTAGAGTDGIRIEKRKGPKVWRDGLTWTNIVDGVLRRTVSKTRFTTARMAVHRIADHPDLQTDLAAVPPEQRIGPLIIDPRFGVPPTAAQYRVDFRTIARLADIPDDVWNMDSRAGALTEAYESGATIEGAMALGTHTQVSTNRRYNRDTLEQTSRVAQLRGANPNREQS